ncbi:MAG TPA: D-amino-acid transaminase [Acidiphilium sp.]|nr:MAG: D-amino acid aminotransferase [Acidiphilium sp. 21-60-14]OYV92131.1 MAG: D-amino acid aminotransferase [Acidiphilium sp. 37-60-79]OZB38951.1 MAG: D-amino acid aminotransferase [Acidiphilium sp. 34-60-192]HQT88485.1 D-amino-acid transaminase [Acidiphilium sp.]HQU23310.1 D-amino-acid transaminase [Acidiphilium sp.]
MSRIAYVNGRYVAHHAAMVSIEDRGYQFGDGVYEVVPIYRSTFIDADLHLARLARSLRELEIPAPMGDAALRSVLMMVARRNRVRDGIVYLQITRGVARRDHAFPARIIPSMVVTARPGPPMPTDIDGWAGGAITVPDIRWGRCDIKSVNLLPNVLAKQAARRAGVYEAILIGPADQVMEGSSTNVWIVDHDGVLRTRRLDHHILPGCTRAALAGLLAENTISFREDGFDLATLKRAREVFLTSATSLVKPITTIDGQPIGNGAVGTITAQLFGLFAAHARAQAEQEAA